MAGETVRTALDHVLSALEPLGHPCALVGGLALAVWNHPRSTRDIDILIAIDSAQLDSVVDQLRGCGCRPKKSPPLIAIEGLRLAQFLYTPPGEFYDLQFDLLLAESEFQRSALARRVAREVAGVDRPVDVIQCDDLIVLKLLAGRMIDRADAAILLRENREAIDFDYLRTWVERLDLTAAHAEVWQEAFPGEDIPDSPRSAPRRG